MQTLKQHTYKLARASLIVVTLASGTAHAFEECFLQIDGVDGGSTKRGHEHAIEIVSYSWEEKSDPRPHQAEARGMPVPGHPQMDSLHVSAHAGKAGPALMLLAANGGYSRQALLECAATNATGAVSPVYRWSFSDAAINSFQSGWVGGQNNSEPVEQIAISFGKISYEYVPAATKVEWDSARNTGGFVNSGATGQQSASHPAPSGPR